jgi:single-strand DNA-binding protein
MANYNKVILIGNLTRDPQLSYLPSQTPVVELGMAVNRRWRGQDNQQREETCFVDCRAYGRQAETINQYARKGEQILLEGRLQFDTWEGKDGTRRSKHRVIVERFQFLGSRPGGGGPAGQPRAARPAQQPTPQAAPPIDEGSSAPPTDHAEPSPYNGNSGDDIPF